MTLLTLSLAVRFLSAHKGQTLLIVLGIAIGVAVQVFVGTLLQSLQADLVERTVGNSPHVTVVSEEEGSPISGWEAVMGEISGIRGIEHLSVAADRSALINTPDNRTFSGLVRGFDLDRSDGIYEIIDRIYEGTPPSSGRDVLVGLENVERYGLRIGDIIEIVLPNGSKQELALAGFFDLGSALINERWVIADIGTVQGMFSMGDDVTSIEMQVEDVFSADSIADKVAGRVSGPGLRVTNWKDENQDLLSALSAQGQSSYMIQFFVLASVMIGIASVLAISVMQRSRQIGILKAMGQTDRGVSTVFLVQGSILGGLGGMVGVLFGLVLFFSFTTFVGAVSPRVNAVFIISSGIVAMLAATLAALIPARRSAKLTPVEVIRNG
jgi:lipoprotein-releasing system permease protein